MRNDSILIANFATGVACPPRIAPPRRRRPRLLAAGSPEAPAPPVPAPDTLPAPRATRYRAARPSVRSVSLGVLSLVLDLPTGAQILRFELDACDLTPGGQVSLWFYRAHTPMGTGLEQVIEASTGSLATPGCDVFEIALPQGPLEVNNATEHYFCGSVRPGGAAFTALRVFYRLQVSPAPAVATFGDVPVGRPQHQYIEALVASGITAGCGGGNYCPDAPLTRGQMAVFLSKGLGLHFAP
jgi:hypothetical protein